MHAIRLSFACLVMLFASAGQLQAGIVTYQFSGTVSIVDDANSVLQGSIIAGQTTFSGSLSFEDTAVDDAPDPTYGRYTGPDISAIVGTSLDVATATLPSATPDVLNLILINDTPGNDHFIGFRESGTTAFGTGISLSNIGINLFDSSGSAFSSDALAGINLAASQFQNGRHFYFEGQDADGNSFLVQGDIDSLARGTVPEPTSLAIFGIGALGLVAGGIRRRKQK